MEITGIKIKKIDTENKMKAIASITIDDCFAIHAQQALKRRHI